MTTYVFKAIDLAGVKAKGEVDAESKQVVSDQLKSRGLIVLDIADKHSSKEIDLAFMKKVKVAELAVFARQLATMITSGMSILRALYVLEEQSESKYLKETIVQVRKDVEAGLSLSDSFARHPKVFSELFVAMARAGEIGGVLEASLIRVADQLERDASLRRQVRSAMMYPAFVVSFAVLVLLALVAFLIPVFEKVYTQFGGELPTITKVSVDLSKLVTGEWWLLIGGFALVVVSFVKWKGSSWGNAQWDRICLRIPMKIGTIVQEVAIARWSRTLASLTSAGVPLLQALEIVGKTSGNVVIEEAMESVISSVKRGGTLSAPLTKASVFPGMVTHMVSVGEETGALDTMLDKIADFYEDRVAASVKALTSLLEPVMIIVIGSIVGFIVISMYMPLFTIYENIE
ncbi:MAG TPA: type II secretion system F family protein [Solirubrobacteraceae bacterium]|jgi:type IV pilus assembly protein PilC